MQHILEPPGFKGLSLSPLTYYQHLQAHLSIERHLHKLMSASKTGTVILGAGIFAKEGMQDDQVPSSELSHPAPNIHFYLPTISQQDTLSHCKHLALSRQSSNRFTRDRRRALMNLLTSNNPLQRYP
jgi:hypothetical protein